MTDRNDPLYPGRFGLPHGDAPGSRFDVSDKMDQIEEANAGIALATARPMECVFNTMPQALFHRASIEDEEMVHFIPSRRDPNGTEIGQNQACWV